MNIEEEKYINILKNKYWKIYVLKNINIKRI